MLNNSLLQTAIKWSKQIEFHWENRGKDLLNSNSVSVQNSTDILCSSEIQKNNHITCLQGSLQAKFHSENCVNPIFNN